jgi:hypothetical protein
MYPQSQFVAVRFPYSQQERSKNFFPVTMFAGRLSPPSKKLHNELAMWKHKHGLCHGRNIYKAAVTLDCMQG